jgi:hypothetical protein
MKPVSPLQIRRLQTLYSAVISRELGSDNSREARLAWASNAIGHSVESFSDLTSAEAKHLIDNLQSEIGQAETEPALSGRLDRDRAQAAGTEGRKNDPRDVTTLVSPDDLQRVHDAVARLGWNQNQFEGWLRSSSSPLKGAMAIHTLGDANRVWWALKNMLKREGKWNAKSA